jgi:hypothetical protein
VSEDDGWRLIGHTADGPVWAGPVGTPPPVELTEPCPWDGRPCIKACTMRERETKR